MKRKEIPIWLKIVRRLCIPRFGYVAAGYTTLACYVLYVAAHYCAMRVIAGREIGSVRIYDVRVLAAMSALFMALGFSVMALYGLPLVRYCFAAGIMLPAFVLRKRIVYTLRQMISARGEKETLR